MSASSAQTPKTHPASSPAGRRARATRRVLGHYRSGRYRGLFSSFGLLATGSVCAEPADRGGNFAVYRSAAAFVGGARSGSILKHYEQREALLLIETGHGEACHLLSISERSATLPSASPLIIRSIALSTTGDDRPLAGVMPPCVASGAAATCE